MNENKKKNNNAIIIILGLILLLVFGVIIRSATSLEKVIINKDMVEIPRINVSLQSSVNNNTHNLTADFYIDVPKKSKDIVSTSQLKTDITQILKNMDFESLNETDSLTEVSSKIKTELLKLYPNLDINGIYASNFVLDYSIEKTTNNSVDKRLKRFEIE